MNGFCCAVGSNIDSINKKHFTKSINLEGTMITESVSEDNFFSSISFLESSPLKGPRVFRNGPLTFLFAGDLIDHKEIPWNQISSNFETSNYVWFSEFRGHFAFAILNSMTNKVFLISDHRSQISINYGYINDTFVFSTNISTFSTLPVIQEFNEEWLYECIFFNFPIDTTTCLKGIKRLTFASVLEVDISSKTIIKNSYSNPFKPSENLLEGTKAYNEGIKVFKKQVPKYFDETNSNYIAFTAGFDSRTILSLASKTSNLTTYTYGIKGTTDLKVASSIAQKLKLKHKKVFFGEELVKAMPNLIYDSVRLSGGMGTVFRSTLPYAYKSLYNQSDKNNTSVIISGIGGDFFRGDDVSTNPSMSNSIMSFGICEYFKKGITKINRDNYSSVFKKNYSLFENHIEKTLKKLNSLYGEHDDPASFMLYDIYEVSPKYFGGEMAIASNYFTFRAPYLDKDIIKFGFSSKISNLGLSPYQHKKKFLEYKKYVFQTKVMRSNPRFKSTYIRGLPIFMFAMNSYFLFKISRIFVRGLAYLRGHKAGAAGLENWDHWFKNILNEEFEKILNSKCLLSRYIDMSLIEKIRKSNNLLLINKLVSTEILLNLIQNKWDIKD